MLRFRAFRAIDDLDACKKYREGHIKVLMDYGITNITSNTDVWMFNPNIYCVVAEDIETGELYGGIRIQISDENNLLPVETAIGKMDPNIYQIVKEYRLNGGAGELCALWNAKKVAGIGISILLTRAAISITNQLAFKTLMGICAEYTLAMFRRVGFVVNQNLGTNGEFPYPNENYIARVLGIMNAETLETAQDYDKERMKSLRDNRTQSFTENEGKGDVEIHYDLTLRLKSHA